MKTTEIFKMSFQSLRTNKLRTFLTVLGVVVGIFSIIVIMTIITMLQNSIESGLASLAKNTFQIQKYPAIMTGGPGARDKYRNRKDITLDEFYQFKEKLNDAKFVGAEQWQYGIVVQYGNKETNPNIQVAGMTEEALETNEMITQFGRPINKTDVQYTNNVCLLGKDIVDKLFLNIDPVGQVVRVAGRPLTVIGTLEPKQALFGQSQDSYVIMPISTFQTMYGKRSRSINITVMSNSQADYNRVIEASIGYMRTIRNVKPGEDNNFDIFSNESIMGQINNINEPIKIGALVISLIALLAAGVGIMNIMLVSVTERTREIGIRKAIGARKSYILIQFLSEAVILSIFGGLIGIIIGVGLGNFAGSFLNAQMAIPVDWVMIGIGLCIFVGVVFGTYPAYKAANLDPIEALRHE
ncbi:MAG: peptide ABC transporter permease [Ignavibacteria bacterium CG22_combo_CG10-13_8_21_14_all_37_15]|nr:FtsX-like permease family protein [Ignavibacteria bacterium]OIO19468.1 MAG: peptide ABC transporter permease [Ignavibacteria bacterium CG1_02_37_35]PIP79346.1 MAG: peptide ABC transporter permease [Ignavibacteria bacterium CG22_combo_CG10-13_8_21_14_all_37_15]